MPGPADKVNPFQRMNMEDDLRYEEDDQSDIDYDTPAFMPEDEAEALERASWHMRMAAQYEAEKEQLAAVYRKEIERLQLRLTHRERILNGRIAWHEAPVESLHLALLRSNPKRKTIELPYGTSKVRVPATPRIEFVDQAETLKWAEENREEILGHTINITGVKAVAKVEGEVAVGKPARVVDADTGEVIPGVQAVLDEPSWSSRYDS